LICLSIAHGPRNANAQKMDRPLPQWTAKKYPAPEQPVMFFEA